MLQLCGRVLVSFLGSVFVVMVKPFVNTLCGCSSPAVFLSEAVLCWFVFISDALTPRDPVRLGS